jgi:peptide/nickel transport system permease protein
MALPEHLGAAPRERDLRTELPWLSPARGLAALSRWGRRYPLGAVGAVVVGIMLIVAFAGTTLTPYTPTEIAGVRLQGPSAAHVWGTDSFGRDVFSRTIAGTRISVIVAVVASTLATAIALTLGTLAGYAGRWTDAVIQRFVDATMAFPGLILLTAAVAVTGPGLRNVAIILGVLPGIRASRVIRAAVLRIRGTEFIVAARAMGATQPRILARHVVPNTFGPAMVIASTVWGTSILAEASLSFLGLGVPPPAPSWGGMISGGRLFMEIAPWTVVPPSIALALTVFGCNMLGDALRDAFDPRSRGRG